MEFCPLIRILFVKNHYLYIAQLVSKAEGISEYCSIEPQLTFCWLCKVGCCFFKLNYKN